MGATHWPESLRHLWGLLWGQDQSQDLGKFLPILHHPQSRCKILQWIRCTTTLPLPTPCLQTPKHALIRASIRDAKRQLSSWEGGGGLFRPWPLRLLSQPLHAAGAAPRTHWPVGEGSAKPVGSRLPRQQVVNLLLSRREIPTWMATSLCLQSSPNYWNSQQTRKSFNKDRLKSGTWPLLENNFQTYENIQ